MSKQRVRQTKEMLLTSSSQSTNTVLILLEHGHFRGKIMYGRIIDGFYNESSRFQMGNKRQKHLQKETSMICYV